MRNRLRLGDGFANGLFQAADDFTREGSVVVDGIETRVLQNFLRAEVAIRRVMLMQGMDCDAAWNRACGVRDGETERIMALVRDPDPIHRAQHDRRSRTEQHHAARTQGHIPGVRHGIVGEMAAHRRCCIHVEASKAKSGVGRHFRRRRCG